MFTLVIDDERTLRADVGLGVVCHARTSDSGAWALLMNDGSGVDFLYLDHDLGGDDTTMPVVDMMCEAAHEGDPFNVGVVRVHSQNPSGAATIVRSLRRYGYNVERVGLQDFLL